MKMRFGCMGLLAAWFMAGVSVGQNCHDDYILNSWNHRQMIANTIPTYNYQQLAMSGDAAAVHVGNINSPSDQQLNLFRRIDGVWESEQTLSGSGVGSVAIDGE